MKHMLLESDAETIPCACAALTHFSVHVHGVLDVRGTCAHTHARVPTSCRRRLEWAARGEGGKERRQHYSNVRSHAERET